MLADILHNRSQYALFITMLLVMLVLSTSSVLVLLFESADPNANIKTGGDAMWWSFVTITTVGYGDRYPVTGLGRATGVGVMFVGIGVIGALASILASLLVSPASTPEAEPVTPSAAAAAAGLRPSDLAAAMARVEATLSATRTELEQARAELAALHRAVEQPPRRSVRRPDRHSGAPASRPRRPFDAPAAGQAIVIGLLGASTQS